MSAPSSASPKPAAPPAWSPPAHRPTRSAGRRCADRWAARCGCRSSPASPPRRRSREARRHGCRIVATVPRGGQPLVDADLSGRGRDSDRRRRRGPRRRRSRRSRRAGDDPDGRRRSSRSTPRWPRRCWSTRRRRQRHDVGARHPGNWHSMDSLFPDEAEPRVTPARDRRRSPSGCGRAPSTSSSARRSCSRRASRCAKRSSATCCSRSSCGDRRAPARPRWRGSSPTRRRRGSSRSAPCWPASRKSAR